MLWSIVLFLVAAGSMVWLTYVLFTDPDDYRGRPQPTKGCVMLVLSRKINECIRVGKDIEFRIVRIGPNSVRVGVTAPDSMNIVRTELELFHDAGTNDHAVDGGPARGRDGLAVGAGD
jgi:carbon storage regulator